MKFTYEIEGDLYEDRDEFTMISNAGDLYSKISDASEAIRSRLKYHENIGDEEAKFLEQIRQLLYVPYLD